MNEENVDFVGVPVTLIPMPARWGVLGTPKVTDEFISDSVPESIQRVSKHHGDARTGPKKKPLAGLTFPGSGLRRVPSRRLVQLLRCVFKVHGTNFRSAFRES